MAKQARGSEAATHDEAETVQPKKHQLPTWDKFFIDAQPVAGKEKTYKLTCIRIERECVSDEQTIEILNAHSHSTLRKYYPKGTMKVGDEETVTIN